MKIVAKHHTESSQHAERFHKLLSHLCLRPGTYTHGATWQEIIAFIDGFWMGADLYRDETIGLCGFRVWLGTRVGLSADIAGGWPFMLLQNCNDDETEALRQLPALYHEFTLSK